MHRTMIIEGRETGRGPAWLPALFLLWIAAAGVAVGQETVFLVPAPATASWRDLVALPTVAAAAAAAEGTAPLVVAVDPAAPWRPELRDFLTRLAPARLVWVGGAMPDGAPEGPVATAIEGSSLEEVACALARWGWKETPTAVVCRLSDRVDSFAAAVLAGRLRVPLLPVGDGELGEATRATIADLGVRELLAVGAGEAGKISGVRLRRLADPQAVLREMKRRRLKTDYLALVQPDDATAAQARNLAIAAVLLAVGRDGAVLPWAGETIWKRPFATQGKPERAPGGVDETTDLLRAGTIELDGVARDFVTGRDREGFWARIDCQGDGDGAFDDEGEGPRRTGEVVSLGERAFTVDVDADEKKRGETLWLTSPTVDEVRAAIHEAAAALGRMPGTLCIVGWPQTFPLAVVSHGQGIDADLVSDLPYAQLDGDPFADVAFARFVAEDVASATLLASRGFAYDRFEERAWSRRFATAEWEELAQGSLGDAGLEHVGHHPGGKPIAADSPLTRAGFIVHGSHAMWTEMGKTYAWNTEVLLAPCLVESSGCSTAALDMDPRHRSVALRLLRNGALAFAGNSRRGTARQELFRSEFWNGLHRGLTLGAANRDALNRALVAGLDAGQVGKGLRHYQLYCAAVFGDPALALDLPLENRGDAARVELRGSRALVLAPKAYRRTEYAPLAEWGCKSDLLTTWRGPMLGADSVWFGPDKRNEDELWYTAEIRTRRSVTGVKQVGDLAPPLGWAGRSYVDEHFDGSRSLLWRIRLIDFDMMAGKIRDQVDKVAFLLQTR